MINGLGSNFTPIVPDVSSAGAGKLGGSSPAGGFGDVLKQAIQGVDTLQSNSDAGIGSLLQGGANADVSDVMVSVEKADVAFQLMMQVRNKIVSAYQDIEKMQF